MAKFDVTSPEGKKFRITAPDGTSREDALAHFRSQMEGSTPSENEQAGDIPPSMWGQTGLGFLQGLAGPFEAGYQWLGGTLPKALTDFQNRADATVPGQVGEVMGNIPTFLLGGEALDALGVAGRIPGLARFIARNPRTATTLSTAAQSTIAQPSKATNWEDFLKEKAEDAGLGAILGRLLGRPIQRAAHESATEANRAATEAHAQTREWDQQANEAARRAAEERTATDEENRLHANEIATRRAREGTAADIRATRAQNQVDRQAVEQQNAAAQAAHAQTVATEREQHQALSEAQQAYHTQQRQRAQAAADALRGRKQTALDARDAARTARRDIPAQTTTGWWQRTGARIGESVPTDAAADTGAHVQKAVGVRLNTLTDRMNLDPESAGLKDQLQEIRRQTSARLQKQNQGGFFSEEARTPLQGLVYDKEGALMPRTAGAPPPKVSGQWVDQVLNPLEKGPLTGRKLTEYISRLGDEANQLATRARAIAPGNPDRADLLAQADAYRQAQDTVIGHAAGSSEDKLALERARQAYMMWGVGNDAAKASQGGVANPSQLIDRMVRRLGEARYKQALADPKSPFHDELNWLQQQRDALAVRSPTDREVTRPMGEAPPIPPTRPTPIPAPGARTPPREIPLPSPRDPPPARQPIILGPEPPHQPHVIPEEPPPTPRDVPARPNYPRRSIPSGLAQVGAGAAITPWHPLLGPGITLSGLRSLLRRSGGDESSLEAFVRRALTDRPRAQRAARGGAAGTAATGQRDLPSKKELMRLPKKAADAIKWAWGSGQ